MKITQTGLIEKRLRDSVNLRKRKKGGLRCVSQQTGLMELKKRGRDKNGDLWLQTPGKEGGSSERSERKGETGKLIGKHGFAAAISIQLGGSGLADIRKKKGYVAVVWVGKNENSKTLEMLG